MKNLKVKINNYNLLKHSDIMINFFSTLNIEQPFMVSFSKFFENHNKNYNNIDNRKNFILTIIKFIIIDL